MKGREKRIKMVKELKEKFEKGRMFIATDFTGMTVPEMNELRRALRSVGVEYKVVKNTLAKIALKEVGKEKASPLIEGPTGIAFSYDDVMGMVKTLVEFESKEFPLKIKGGFFEGRILSEEDIKTLSKLPPREELISKAIGCVKAPMYNLVAALSAPLRNLIFILSEREKSMRR